MVKCCLLAAGVLWVAGCSAPPPVVPPALTTCLVPTDSIVRPDTLTVVFEGDAEALAFANEQVHQTLVQLDCQGVIVPAAAVQWGRVDEGRTWMFAMSPNGLTADRVAAAWESRRNGGIWPWPHILTATPRDHQHLLVTLDTAFAELPMAFALPPLTLFGAVPAGMLPVGTGDYRVALLARPSNGPFASVMVLEPTNLNVRAPVLVVEVLRPGTDPRDVFDLPDGGAGRSADMLVTRDRLTLDFARKRRQFSTWPMAWDQTYQLVGIGTDGPPPANNDLLDLQRSLAQEVVLTDTRPAGDLRWQDQACLISAAARPTGEPRVFYPDSDRVAQALAERVTALANAGRIHWLDTLLGRVPKRPLFAAAASPDSLAAWLAAGRTGAFIVPEPLVGNPDCAGYARRPAQARVIPLVDTRSHLIIQHPVGWAVRINGTGLFRVVSEPVVVH